MDRFHQPHRNGQKKRGYIAILSLCAFALGLSSTNALSEPAPYQAVRSWQTYADRACHTHPDEARKTRTTGSAALRVYNREKATCAFRTICSKQELLSPSDWASLPAQQGLR